MRKATLISTAALSATALLLAGCGSKNEDKAGDATTCPSAAAPTDGKVAWTLPGMTGQIKIVAPTAAHSPGVTVQAPFTVGKTTVQTLTEGKGEAIKLEDTVSVCYMGVNGRDGSVFDSAYQRGAPTPFPLTNVVPGFQKAIVGQKPGATVAVAMTPADGYGPMGGQPDAHIQADDSLVFVLQIKGLEAAETPE
ncbi:FKBP-type peptidyl-prolyl cis-trans isomerase [Gordonia sp. (in: high G+C Gram-positive bacteria)]|uniref:FKBP-type peptidyl-prolyl cis-trans isomerase n=1 Tax=Gordonia sp. (in: high G+C Gram-positive bacteria) TaxID=84139 RepID=UPI0039E47962